MIYIIHRKYVFDGGSMKSWNAVTAYSEVFRTGIKHMAWTQNFHYKKEAVDWCKKHHIDWMTEKDWENHWNNALEEAGDGDIWEKAAKILNKRLFHVASDDNKRKEKINLNKVSREFQKYVFELIDGRHEGTTLFRNEMLDVYKSLISGKEITTISQDVHDAVVKYGFTAKESGMGWTIQPLVKSSDTNVSKDNSSLADSPLEAARQEGRLEMARKICASMFELGTPLETVRIHFQGILSKECLSAIRQEVSDRNKDASLGK